jgi:peroxiredoxin
VREFRLETLDGERFFLSEHVGKKVVCVFWSLMCIPCRQELIALSKDALLEREDVVLVAICVDPDARSGLRRFSRACQNRIRMLLDYEGKLSARWNVHAYPLTVILDKHGNEFARLEGYNGRASLDRLKKILVIMEKGER